MLGRYPKYLEQQGVMVRLPIVDWSTEEVMEYIGRDRNPLYDQGFERVGCFPCLASGDKWKIKAFEHDDFGREQYTRVKELEEIIDKSVFTSGIGKRWEEGKEMCELDKMDDDDIGCLICSM